MMIPVETKVKASTTAAAVSGLALWAMGRYLFRHGVPDVVASWVYVIVPGILALAAGYLAPHTSRPPPAPPAPPSNVNVIPPSSPLPGLPEAKL